MFFPGPTTLTWSQFKKLFQKNLHWRITHIQKIAQIISTQLRIFTKLTNLCNLYQEHKMEHLLALQRTPLSPPHHRPQEKRITWLLTPEIGYILFEFIWKESYIYLFLYLSSCTVLYFWNSSSPCILRHCPPTACK